MDAGTMRSMSDAHLASAARAEIDTLTSTPLEVELLGRFERLLDEASTDQELYLVIADFDITGEALRALCEAHPASLTDITAMLTMLNDLDIHEPGDLRRQLDIAAGFETLATEAGDIFARLNNLTTETTKEPQ
jgi:hypothetical protein